MNFFIKIALFLILVLVSSCSGKKQTEEIILEKDLDLQMIESYKAGKKALAEGDALFAVKKFNEAEILFPQSIWAPRAALMAAYSYYSWQYYGDAVAESERFLKTYPNNPNIAYAHYLIALCYYENIQDEKRNLKTLIQAKEKFQFILLNFANTDFALDAKYKMDLIEDILASKEIYIGKYYLQKDKWIPAINRFKTVVEEYSGTVYVEEALHRLVEIHYKLGLDEEAKKYASVLGYNYQSGEWYKKSYKIFNKNFSDKKKKEVDKKKDKKNSILKKFKSIFE